jgi:hypothetical protein
MSEPNPPHPLWPSFFDVDILVFDKHWQIVDNRLHLGLAGPGAPEMVIIDSVTRLPDELVFIRGRFDDGSEPGCEETYYGIASWEQYEDKRLRHSPG